ncbi:MAG TPA: glycosyltransferase [Candidatus Binatia bacterium]|nr:glycosyltransferase [Candidatus Binatia bacterium]
MISIIIATRDRASYLLRALDSLERQIDAPPFEVIVVDNGSTDETPQIARAAAGRFALTYLHEAEPNRGAARNRGLARAGGELIAFIDDDVWLPQRFLAAHAAAHAAEASLAVSGPIINVPSYDVMPRPTPANYSRAFFCTCNVSLPKAALEAAGGFDERFRLYGWEDTELGLRLRESGLRRRFAWDAFLYHIKPPARDTLDVATRRTIEKARMAARLIQTAPSLRTRLATGAYPLNLARARLIAPRWVLPLYAGVATQTRIPALAGFARGLLLDGLYVDELGRALGGRL